MSSKNVSIIEYDINIYDISASTPPEGQKNARKTGFSAKMVATLCILEVL